MNPPEPEIVIHLRGLQRSYRMGSHEVQALRGIDLQIRRGEFVAIVGPSGSGKSTLMYLLGCLDRPTAGSYALTGKDVASLSDRELSRLRNASIGFVFQAYHLLPELDVVQNVALGLTYAGVSPGRRRPVATALAEGIGLRGRTQHKATELSGGQMQRVAIARALAVRPAIILADEPTGNLDSHTGTEIMAVFHALHARGNTIVLVTHDPLVAAQAERVVTIVDGSIQSDTATGHRAPPAPASAAPLLAALQDETAAAGLAAGRIRFADLLRMAVREGLLAHKLRSFLTMLGIIFGIGAVISMTAITEGGREQQLEQIRQIGLNNIQVRDRALEGPALLRARRQHAEGLHQRDLELIREQVDGIEAATAWRQIKAELRAGERVVEDAGVLGITGAFQEVVNYHLAAGRFPDAVDERSFARVCALGPQLAAELGLGEQPLGAVVQVGDQPCRVVGLMQHKDFVAGNLGEVGVANRNRELYLPYSTVDAYFRKAPRESHYDVVSLRMASDAGLVQRAELIERIVADAHRQADDVAVSVPIEKLKQAQQTREVFNLIITVIAAISLLVGGIGIMNIMLATVTERTREIGIRRAIGASRRDITGQFLTEAVLLSTIGGGLGVVAGVGGALLVERGFGFAVAFDPQIIGIAVGVSVALGVAFGLYPAWLAAHKDPVEALRS